MYKRQVQTTGQPGKDAAAIYVRGVGSLNDSQSKPLILAINTAVLVTGFAEVKGTGHIGTVPVLDAAHVKKH